MSLRYCEGGGRVEIGSFRVDDGFTGREEPEWLDNTYDDYSTGYVANPLSPTHWMPLPPPPPQQSGGGMLSP